MPALPPQDQSSAGIRSKVCKEGTGSPRRNSITAPTLQGVKFRTAVLKHQPPLVGLIEMIIGDVQTQGINIAWRLAGTASFHAIAAGAFKIPSVPSRFICNPTGRKLGFARILVSMWCAICGWVARRCCGGSSGRLIFK